jgi:hypothetical protein
MQRLWLCSLIEKTKDADGNYPIHNVETTALKKFQREPFTQRQYRPTPTTNATKRRSLIKEEKGPPS